MKHEIQSGSAGRRSAHPAVVGALLGMTIAALLLGAHPAAAGSDFASPWTEEKFVRVRLVDGGTTPGGDRLVGVQIELNEGWYTYWRHPGDGGVAPQFNWDRSRNLASAQPNWPAPTRLVSEYGVSYGYYNGVVFPITVTPVADGPMQLELDLIYAACREICYPLTAKLALTLPAVETSSTFFTRLVAKALTQVPTRQTTTGRPRIVSATPTVSGKQVVLKVTAELAQAGDTATLFVEGPEEYYFRVPGEPAARTGAMATFDVSVEGARTIEDIKGAELTATLVTPSGRIEHRWMVE